jgi:hypothetical protein
MQEPWSLVGGMMLAGWAVGAMKSMYRTTAKNAMIFFTLLARPPHEAAESQPEAQARDESYNSRAEDATPVLQAPMALR